MKRKLAFISLFAALPLVSGCSQSDRIKALEKENAELREEKGSDILGRIEKNKKCKEVGEEEIGTTEKDNYGSTWHEHFYSPKLDACISVRHVTLYPAEGFPEERQMDIIFDSIKGENLFEYRSWCRPYYEAKNYTESDIEKNCPFDELTFSQKVSELKD